MVMSRNMSYYFIGIITIYFYIFISSSLNTFASPTQPLCRRDQSDALLELEKEFHIPPTFWNKSLDCCFWNGVTCDDTLGEVIKLKHSSVDVTSLKPRSGLFKLQHLTHLDLSYCNIQGEIPSSIGNLSRLVYLDFSFNQLGEFPVAIGNLNNLEYVDLRANGLLGELPSSIGNLNQLRYMDLERNELRGNIPISFANFTKLSEIHLARNQFTGGIIVFSNLTSLIHIDISSNRFKSFISSEFSRLTNLTRFWVHNNSFFGPFPTFLFENPSLYEIDLSRNQFTGPIDFGNTSSISKLIKLNAGYNNFDGIIPNSISKLVNLNSLDLSHNNFRGKVPKSISKLVYKYLTNLDISYNMLEGQIPQCLWKNLGLLNHVDLSNNLFNTFGKFVETSDTNIKEIDLGSNLLQGPIPGWICNLPHVEFIDLSNNYFTGSIPKCIKNLTEINTLNLQNNNLSGFLPDLCINDSMYHSLRSLDVSRNNLVGKLPKSLNSCENIEFLDVGGNKISDSFPFWLGSLQRLNILVLKSNEFYGPVYNSSTYLGFPSMKIIDISNNNFTGSLPRDYFVSWPAMSYVWSNEGGSPESEYMGDSNGYEDWIDFVYKGVYTDFDRIFQNFKAIDFSGNLFSGHIPDSIGLLSELRLLNLSGNTFMGKIPPSLENITKLETLDLSRNNLSGEIPEGIGKLSFLSNINFSYNYLEGLVPRSTQFGTQNCTSFVGNIGLYGFEETCGEIHRVPVSTSQQPEKSSEAEEQVINWVAAAITFGPGVFCGLVLGHIFISYKHEWFVASSPHFSRGFVKFVLNK